jgi:hypothetical protein
MWAPLFESLKKHGNALFGSGLPGLTQQAPEIIGERILLGELDIDHREP